MCEWRIECSVRVGEEQWTLYTKGEEGAMDNAPQAPDAPTPFDFAVSVGTPGPTGTAC
jgi:hypothetical protein